VPLVVLTLAFITTQEASAARRASKAIGGRQVANAHAEHPTVSEVKKAGYLTILTRERALDDGTPAHLAWAIADAPGSAGVRKHKVAAAVTRALRARHTIGPSGALLDKTLPSGVLDAREALFLGWLRLLDAKKPAVALKRGRLLTDAGAVQLLELAVAKGPKVQAHHLALALARAAFAPKRGKQACEAWLAVQKAARAPAKASVGLPVAEAASKLSKRLRRACNRKQRAPYSGQITLPAPPAERVRKRLAANATTGEVFAASQRDDVAFAVAAPVFKGYLGVPAIRQIATWSRLKADHFGKLLDQDRTGDQSVAAINAAVSLQRQTPLDVLAIVWQAIAARNRATRGNPHGLRLSVMNGQHAMALGYAKAIAGGGLDVVEQPGDAPALVASPRQLFARARGALPPNAALGPIMAMAHRVDLQRQAGPCRADQRAESLIFVVGKSALPDASRKVLLGALQAVRNQCKIASAGTARPSTKPKRK